MNNNDIILTLLLIIGFFCVGYLWGARPVQYWRIKWIEMEHDLAREQKRVPRDIDKIKKGN